MEGSGFGGKLRQLRQGENPANVAAAVGVTVSSIYRYEAGYMPKERVRIKLAEYYETTVDAIFGGEGNDNAEG
jgi:transcriptional regulator with XRE-family HTH domain